MSHPVAPVILAVEVRILDQHREAGCHQPLEHVVSAAVARDGTQPVRLGVGDHLIKAHGHVFGVRVEGANHLVIAAVPLEIRQLNRQCGRRAAVDLLVDGAQPLKPYAARQRKRLRIGEFDDCGRGRVGLISLLSMRGADAGQQDDGREEDTQCVVQTHCSFSHPDVQELLLYCKIQRRQMIRR
jgi:hypothetical protein